ncbi:Fpg/Nei family DNA glycosylase [Paenarthrobacter sp. Z7-10]|uniref:Fpg/Nei family DNA glycosylase n=1 Tax=Paenarthrobacter sp. Z7-10 TaxID=2787635 RepID=UPI0022A9D225|nr:DNA-formamidopyrimidine glycosylase family protein [Paenarthrobacter sp. Z7-10]MCZ2402577.1 Fpg/Nei family DNA glycosylase [Paenarthrobacter sp. Z7-10]
MPELPEVAGLGSFLAEELQGAVLEKIQITSFSVLKTADPPYAALEGRTLSAARRHGKFLDLELTAEAGGVPVQNGAAGGTGPPPLHLIFHLAKAGWVRYSTSPSTAVLKAGSGLIAARLRFTQQGQARGLDLTEAGTRKSLALYVVRQPSDVPGIASLGPDPLAADFGYPELARLLATGSGQIKGLLRNQSVLAGIGNAYSDEILHAARISPFAIAKSLDVRHVQDLYQAIESVLGEAVSSAVGKAASELKDAKRSSMRVHGRAGQACPVCGDTVREVSFADRALQYCPHCQTEGKILADRRTSKFLK